MYLIPYKIAPVSSLFRHGPFFLRASPTSGGNSCHQPISHLVDHLTGQRLQELFQRRAVVRLLVEPCSEAGASRGSPRGARGHATGPCGMMIWRSLDDLGLVRHGLCQVEEVSYFSRVGVSTRYLGAVGEKCRISSSAVAFLAKVLLSYHQYPPVESRPKLTQRFQMSD